MGRDLEGPGADYALSADETTYLYLDHQEHDLVSVKGHPAVFVEERLNESKIPKGLYLYYVQRSAPDSPFGAVTTLNSGNMCGSVITDTPVLVDQDGRYAFKSKEDGLRFTGTKATIKEYRGGEYDKKAVDALNTPATPKRQSSKSKPASRGR